MLVNVFWSYAKTANGKEMYKSDMHVQKSLVVLLLIQTYFFLPFSLPSVVA